MESYCKESKISDTNWLRYLFHHIWSKLGRCHHVANLHILKSRVSQNEKRYLKIAHSIFLLAQTSLLVCVLTGLDRKYAIFVLVPLCGWVNSAPKSEPVCAVVQQSLTTDGNAFKQMIRTEIQQLMKRGPVTQRTPILSCVCFESVRISFVCLLLVKCLFASNLDEGKNICTLAI